MKTHKVRPVLVETKENTGITLGINITRNIPGKMRGTNYQLILISLEDEKIEVGDKYLLPNGIITSAATGYKRPDEYKKVIATQNQLSPELIQQLIDEYNNGGMKDFEIEMEEKDIPEDNDLHCASDGGYYSKPTSYKRVSKPKLTNDFVTVVKEEPILYTEEEVFALLVASHSEVGKTLIKNIELRKWFNQNKKK